MVYLWYPAEAKPGARTLPYFPDFSRMETAVGEAGMKDEFGAAYPFVKAGLIQTHVVADARLASSRLPYPEVDPENWTTR
jgi:hypothetical protein